MHAAIEDSHAALWQRDLPSLAHLCLGIATPKRKIAQYGNSLSHQEASSPWVGRLHARGAETTRSTSGLERVDHWGRATEAGACGARCLPTSERPVPCHAAPAGLCPGCAPIRRVSLLKGGRCLQVKGLVGPRGPVPTLSQTGRGKQGRSARHRHGRGGPSAGSPVAGRPSAAP